MYKGLFITVEGSDGAGKTTHVPFLEQLLSEAGLEVIVTREPGGTRLGEALREILLHQPDNPICGDTELLLMFAARIEHLEQVILPAVRSGKCVLCDRFTDATYAYQGGGRGVDGNRIAMLEEWVQKGYQPDLTLVFDVSVEVGLSRTCSREERPDRFERENPTFKESVRRAYHDRARQCPDRVKLIDSSHTIEETQDVLVQHVKSLLEPRSLGPTAGFRA